MRETEASLPILHSPGYYTKPSLEELVAQELLDPGYCTRVPNFTVGRLGYGSVRFLEKTDVRGLDLDQIVKFYKHEIVVYSDENDKPAVGQGLNKAAEVVLVLDTELLKSKDRKDDFLVKKVKQSTERQGEKFISFDLTTGEWKFLVDHFSRFGFGEDDEEDIVMDDADGEMYDDDKEPSTNMNGIELSHSLPAHLRLDPVKMREMRLLMSPHEEEPEELSHKASISKEYARPLQNSAQAMLHRSTPPIARKTPFPLLEYKHGCFDANSPGSILMVQQHKGMPLKTIKAEGFKLDLKHETPVSTNYARNIVDAGLFMGKSFRVGWGPNGILVHSGAPVGSGSEYKVLSSVVSLEKVAFDNFVRDENNKVSEELVESALMSPLNFHKEINHVKEEVRIGPCKLKPLKLEANCSMLSDISHGYCDIIERQLTVPGLSSTTRLGLTHQVMTWELIRVLFFDRKQKGQVESLGADNEEDMMQDMKEVYQDVNQEALPLMRRAEFSYCEEREFSFLKAMFSAFSSTPDPLDYHMIWHQRAVLEAVGVIKSNDLHVLDMGFVSQLLSLGKCHWAIYVVLHLPFREDCQFLHVNLIREILFQYCEIWSSDESQQQFIEDLGISSEWIHEALAIYYNYNGDLPKALEHFLQCANWQKAHTIFVTSVAHSLFLQAKHSEIWRIATSMEDHKSEIENWELGGGIYISYYLMRNSLQGDTNAMTQLDSLQSKNAACQEFVSQLNASLAVRDRKLPVDARLVYSKMGGEICDLLLSAVGEGASRDEQFSCFDTAFSAPVPEDVRSGHLQDAVYLFTSFLSEIATKFQKI
ncbi:Nuclear pore complex protein [Arachis hypogaea]|nr:Nuclear pore complex protein [Arachis hypogaea]